MADKTHTRLRPDDSRARSDAAPPRFADEPPMRSAGTAPRTLLAGGTEGNERLTNLTGLLLIVLLAAVGVTIVRIGQLLWLHLFLGLVVLGPVILKLSSTGYRFIRYYSGNPAYRRKGPPAPALRALAPLVVFFTVAVFATGVALLVLGPSSRDPLVLLHKVTFIAWIIFTAIHVLGHLPEILGVLTGARGSRREVMALGSARAAGRDASAGSTSAPTPGELGRGAALGLSLAGGLVIAVALLGQFSVWTH